MSLLRQLLYSSKSRIVCQHFFRSFFTSRVRRPFRNSLFIISSLTYLVNNFFKVLEPFQVCGKSVKTTFTSYHPNKFLSIGFLKKIKEARFSTYFPFLLFVLEKNKINILRRLGDTFIISGSFIIVIGLIFKFIIKSNIYFINISNVINVIFNQFLVISMVFYICGIISYLGYYLIIKSV